MLVSSEIPSLANGVSQQPDAIRLPSQVSALDNVISSLVEGTKRRPPSEHISHLTATVYSNPYIHWIDRDTSERYVVTIVNGDLYVHDLSGNAKTVNFPDGKTYLNCSSPKDDLFALSIVDYTFIVNKTKTVAKIGPVAPPNDSGVGTVYVRQAGYSVTYTVEIDGTSSASYTTPSASGADTEAIANNLQTQLTANLGSNWTVTRKGSVLKIVRNDGQSFTVKTKDTAGDTYLYGFTDKVQRFENLPGKGFNGITVEVAGDPDNNWDSYYVTFSEDNNVWEETVKPQHADSLDPTTMPHILVREADGTFTFKRGTWEPRLAGDRDSSPDPSFVGRTINSLVFYASRLGMLADDNVILSAVGSNGFFQFFPETVRQVLDTAPIDIAATASKVTILKSGIEFDGKLILLSDKIPQILSGGDILSQNTVSIKPGPEFEADLLGQPVALSKTVIFAIKNGLYSGVGELFIDPDTQRQDVADITSHVPTYIPAQITKFAASQKDGKVFALTSGAANVVYLYEFLWNGNEKVQSSWKRLVFATDASILSIERIDHYLYMLISRVEGTFLERLNFQPKKVDTGFNFRVALDRRFEATGTYDAANGWTTWTIPFPVNVNTDLDVVLGSSFTGRAGAIVNGTTRPTTTTIRATGDYSGGPCFIGVDYSSLLTLSKATLGVNDGRGRKPVLTGSLKLRRTTFNHADTNSYKVTITPLYGDSYEDTFVARAVNQATLGQISVETGKHTVAPMGNADSLEISVTSVKHLPFSILGYAWEGNYTARSQRV